MARRDTPKSSDKSLPGDAQELFHLVVGYAKQETLDPIKNLGRFIAFGLAGAIVGSIGAVLLLLSGLRALQTETGSTFRGNLSWIPYVLVLIVSGAIAGGALQRRNAGQRGRDRER